MGTLYHGAQLLKGRVKTNVCSLTGTWSSSEIHCCSFNWENLDQKGGPYCQWKFGFCLYFWALPIRIIWISALPIQIDTIRRWFSNHVNCLEYLNIWKFFELWIFYFDFVIKRISQIAQQTCLSPSAPGPCSNRLFLPNLRTTTYQT